MTRSKLTIRVVVGFALILAVLLRLNWENREWHEPYGGCKEASSYPDSVGYAECKAHGLVP